MNSVPRMIAIDMDGTLVHPGGTITPENQAAIHAAQAAGARIVIATGRRHSYAMKILRTIDLDPEDIVLSSNGAVARTVGGRLIFRRTMPLDTARWLCTQLGEFRNAFVLTFDLLGEDGEDMPGSLVLEELEELHGSISKWMEANAPYIRQVQPIEDALHREEGDLPIQAMLCGTMERMARAETILTAANDDRLSLSTTQYPARDLCILDILPHGCSKGAGLLPLLEQAHLTPQDLMAIGDNWNDLSMFEIARWPVLMGNAPEPLLALAQSRGWQVTANHDEHGVAEALSTHFPSISPEPLVPELSS